MATAHFRCECESDWRYHQHFAKRDMWRTQIGQLTAARNKDTQNDANSGTSTNKTLRKHQHSIGAAAAGCYAAEAAQPSRAKTQDCGAVIQPSELLETSAAAHAATEQSFE
eukprot:2715990-Rhodomonas_salina.1